MGLQLHVLALDSALFLSHTPASCREQWRSSGLGREPERWPEALLDVCSGQPSPGPSGLLTEASPGSPGVHRADVPLVLSGVSAWPARGTGWLCVRAWGSVCPLPPQTVPLLLFRKPPLPPLSLFAPVIRASICFLLRVGHPCISLPIRAQTSASRSHHLNKPLCLKRHRHWSRLRHLQEESADGLSGGLSSPRAACRRN